MVASQRDNRKALGANGEATVRLYLERLGWKVLEENYRCRLGEIDLIAGEPTDSGEILVFVEVKTRRGGSHGTPIAAVGTRKQTRMIAVANAYLGARGSGGQEPACRFDIAEVQLGLDGHARVTLHRGAFTA